MLLTTVVALPWTGLPAAGAATRGALQLDGVDDHVSFGAAPSLASASFTVETWFKRTGPGVATRTGAGGLDQVVPLVAKGRAEADGSTVDMNYLLGIDAVSGTLVADFEEGAAGASPGLNHPVAGRSVVSSGAWHHAAATYDGSTWRLYLDGVEDGSLVVGQPARGDSVQHASLGTALNSAGVPAGAFAGVLDEARVWSVARSGAAIGAAMADETVTGPGLLGRWALDEGSGTTVASSTGGPTGTTAGGPAWTAGFPLAPDTVPPAAPAGLSVTGTGDRSVALQWVRGPEPDLAGHRVYRATGTGGSGGTVPLTSPVSGSQLVAGSSFVDTSVSNGTAYRYVVTAVDASGNESGPSGEVGATPSAAGAASSVQLDGVDDHVSFGAAPSLASASFTVETWFKRTGPGVATRTGAGGLDQVVPLVAKGRAEADGSTVDMNYLLGIDAVSGTLVADFEEGAAGASPGLNHPVAGRSVVSSGAWHHAAATYDGSTWRLYLDGVEDGSLVVGQPARGDSVQHASLGTALNSAGVPAGAFAGLLDETRVWDHARSAAQVAAGEAQEIATGSGLVGRWAFDEGAGTLARTSSGSVDGVLRAGAGWGPGFAAPAPGPSAPALVSPADGATGPTTSPQLSVRVTDPGGQAMSVRFYGRPSASGLYRLVGTRTGVASGSTVSTPWPGLGSGQLFQWYAVADNGSSSTTGPTWTLRTAPGADPVIVGAGDIAKCTSQGDEATAAVVAGVDGLVFTTGDNVYEDGTAAEFAGCYDPSWGQVRDRTRPAPGNHEWNTGSLAGYNSYFGAAATDAGGKSYYSYDISPRWHAVVLDTECARVGGCDPGSPQEVWLKSDLAAHADQNVVVLWHKPRFSSAPNSTPELAHLVQVMYDAGVDLLLAGHDHIYERFAPLDPGGAVDTAHGIPMFTLGTGGANHHQIVSVQTGSLVRNNDTYGVTKFTLHASGFDWEFLPQDGATFTDSGSLPTRSPAGGTPPVVDTVSVAPAAPRTASVLQASVTAHDADGDALTYAYQWTRNGSDIAGATAATFDLSAPGAGDRGDTVTVRVQASDGSGLSQPVTSAPVTVANTAPVVAAMPGRTDTAGTSVSFAAPASDADGDPVVWSASGLPAGTSITPGTGTIAGTPSGSSVGSRTVTVTASDGAASSSTTFVWSVTAAAPADPPPAAPQSLSGLPTTVSVELDWADNTADNDLAGYRVYRSAAATGPWTRLTPSLLGASAYSDATAPVGAVSNYRVTAVDTAGQESAPAAVSVTRRLSLVGTSTAAKADTKSLKVSRPAGVTSGDLLVAAVTTRSAQTPNAPSGWVTVRSDVVSSSLRQTVFRRVAVTSEPSSYTFTVAKRDSLAAVVVAYRGVATAAATASSGAGTLWSTTVTAPSVTSPAAGSLVLGLYATATTAGLTPPSALAARAQVSLAGSAPVRMVVSDAVRDAGPTGSQTATVGAASTSVGQLVVLRT